MNRHRAKELLNGEEYALLEKARFGGRVGFGSRPALLVIDVQNYMIGPMEEDDNTAYLSACPAGRDALPHIQTMVEFFRAQSLPVVYSQFLLNADGRDVGVYGRKRELLTGDGWCLAGTRGAQIVSAVAPAPGDHILVKNRPSAFWGTPLLGYLIDRAVDTVIIVGGATSNCVRATAVDAMSYNYRTIVVEDAVFDRFRISHEVALFDLDRQYADVMLTADVVDALSK